MINKLLIVKNRRISPAYRLMHTMRCDHPAIKINC